MLVISGEKHDERKDDKHGRPYTERFYGKFRRTIPLQSEVDPEKVDAKFKNGVLTVTLPKSQKAQATERRIEIRPQ
jgi:HSP20 family protein